MDFEFLKEILKEKLKEGVDIESVIAEVAKDFPKHAVPKAEFNEKLSALKEANKTIDKLKEENTGNTELQAKISEYETSIEKLKAEKELTEKTYLLKSELSKLGVLDSDYLIFKQGGIDKFEFDKDGKITNLEDIVKPYKESSPYLFAKGYEYKPQGGGANTSNNPFAKDSFNLTEQGKLIKTDPARAKELASLAGIEI